MSIWRDLDNRRRQWGLAIWSTGGEVRLGRRLYRARWAR